MANRLLETLKYPFVKVMTLLTLSGAPAAAAAQHTSQEQNNEAKPETEVLRNISPENGIVREADLIDTLELNKTHSFDDLRTVPWVISNDLNTEYVMNLTKWRESGNNSEVEIKRAYKDQVVNHDLTTVMELRESYIAGDAVNLNKSHTRMFICQGNTICGEDFVRMLYFSQNENLHKFAAKYIGNYNKPLQKTSPQTAEEAVKKIKDLLYDKQGNLKLGKEGREERRKAFLLMRCFSTREIFSKKVFKKEFIKDFKDLDRQFHDELLQAEKEYCIGFYNLENSRNIPAQKADTYAKKHNLRNASCIPVGLACLHTSSLIAAGPYSLKVLREKKPLKNAAIINRTDYITLECVRQMALAGYNGAEEMYNAFSEAVKQDRKKIEERGNALMPDQQAKPDVIKRPQVFVIETQNKKLTPEEIHIRLIKKLHESGSR